MPLVPTLKRRSQFQRIRGGGRWANAVFIMEGKARQHSASPKSAVTTTDTASPVAQFGFTVTKKLGNAVVRNRIRRRLKAALAATAPSCARPEFDYVIVARPSALDHPFESLLQDLRIAFLKVHSQTAKTKSKSAQQSNMRVTPSAGRASSRS